MQPDERRKLENQLIVMGLNKLSDPELVPQMAKLILNDEFFLGMINECDQEKRYEMYHAIRPHLCFEPKPLEWYESRLKERADAIASWHDPVEVGGTKYHKATAADATGVVIDLKCQNCPKKARYYGKTHVDAVIQARQDGWVRDLIVNKEVCPKCPAQRTEKRKCPTCTRKHYAPDCRERSVVIH